MCEREKRINDKFLKQICVSSRRRRRRRRCAERRKRVGRNIRVKWVECRERGERVYHQFFYARESVDFVTFIIFFPLFNFCQFLFFERTFFFLLKLSSTIFYYFLNCVALVATTVERRRTNNLTDFEFCRKNGSFSRQRERERKNLRNFDAWEKETTETPCVSKDGTDANFGQPNV